MLLQQRSRCRPFDKIALPSRQHRKVCYAHSATNIETPATFKTLSDEKYTAESSDGAGPGPSSLRNAHVECSNSTEPQLHSYSNTTNLQELKSLLENRHQFKPQDVAPLVSHLLHLWQACPGGLLESSMLSDMLPHIYSTIMLHMDNMKPRDQAKVAATLAQLRFCDAEVLQKLAEALQPQLGRVAAPDMAALLVGLAAHNARPSQSWLAAFMSEALEGLGELGAGELAAMLPALARLGVRPTSPWLLSFVDALQAAGMQALPPRDLSSLSRTFGEFGFQPPPSWMADYLQCSQQLLHNFQAHELADLASGLTSMGVRPDAEWVSAFVQVTEARMPSFRARDLVVLAEAVSRLGVVPHQAWLHSLLHHTYSAMPQFRPQDLPALLASVVGLHSARAAAGSGSTDQEQRPGIQQGLQGLQAGTTGSSTTSTATSSSTTATASIMSESAPESRSGSAALEGPWMARFLSECHSKLPRFTAGGLATLLTAVAEAGVRPDTAWLHAYAEAACGKSQVLSAPDLASIACTLVLELGYVPTSPALREQLAAELRSKVLQLSNEQLACGLSALARLEGAAAKRELPAGTSSQQHAALQWPAAVLSDTRRRCPGLTARQVGEVMAAVVQLGLRPDRRWLQAFVSKVECELLAFDAGSMRPVVWALALLGQAAPLTERRAVVRILQRAAALAAQQASNGIEGPARASAHPAADAGHVRLTPSSAA